jgi:hypothetical protein
MPGGGGIDMGIGGFGCFDTLTYESQGYSLYLDGTDDRVQGNLTTSMFQDFTADQDWSLKFTFKLDTIGAAQTLCAVGPTSDYIWIVVNTDGKLVLYSVTGVTSRLTRFWTAGIAADTWYEVVITCDASGTQRALVCYVNAVAKTLHTTNVSTSSTSLLPASGKVGWGSFFNLVDFDFKLDSIASWSSVLTAGEVTAIHGTVANPGTPNLTQNQHGYISSQYLTSYYKFEEGTGTSIADSSGHPGTTALTIINTSTWSDDTRINPE